MFHANSLPSSPSTHHRPPLILRFSFRFSRFSTMSRFPTVSFNLYPRLRFLSPFSLLALEFSSNLCRPETRRIFFPLSRKSLSPFPMYRSRDPPVFLFKDFLRPFLDIFLPSPSSFRFFPSSVPLCLQVSFSSLPPSRYFFSFFSDCGNSRTRDVYTQLLTRIQDSRYKMPCHTPHLYCSASSYTVIQNFESCACARARARVHMCLCVGEEFENSVSFPSSTRAKICSLHFPPLLLFLFPLFAREKSGRKIKEEASVGKGRQWRKTRLDFEFFTSYGLHNI